MRPLRPWTVTGAHPLGTRGGESSCTESRRVQNPYSNGRRDSGGNDGHGGSSGFRSGSGRPLTPYKNGRGSSRRSF